ncbi:MAG: endonuclease/exonuclease/phosphatase family protein, partial [Nitrospiraceae bacterium]
MRRFHLIAPLLLFLSIALVAGQTFAADFRGKELTIATWNIEWLDAELNRDRVKRDLGDLAALNHFARQLHADVVALQEVDGPEAARWVYPPNEYEYHFSVRRDVMRVGFAIRKGVQWQANPDYSDLDVGDVRHGVDIT